MGCFITSSVVAELYHGEIVPGLAKLYQFWVFTKLYQSQPEIILQLKYFTRYTLSVFPPV